MKKFTNVFMKMMGMAIVPVMLLSGCGSTVSESTSDTDSAVAEAKEPAPSDITSAIMAEIEIPSAVEKTIDDVPAYYDVNTDEVDSLSVYICGSGAYPDELAVFKMNSSEAAETAVEAVQKRLDSQSELYRDYTPAEMYKLEGASVTVKENYVMLFVCSDDDRALEIAESLF